VVIAFASGKGGTGKTFLATNVAASQDRPTTLIDCDVEEPNCHLFFPSPENERREVTITTPSLNREACTGCGECGAICAYYSLVCFGGPPEFFPEMCHGCEGCFFVCPTGALIRTERRIGVVERRSAGHVSLNTGQVDVGRSIIVPIIRELTRDIDRIHDELTIIDCPPGTSCAASASIKAADVVVLVSEDTPFARSDLARAIILTKRMGIPAGVVENRASPGTSLEDLCRDAGIPHLARFERTPEIASDCARGELSAHRSSDLRSRFSSLAAEAALLRS
jgi:MinD superfamily P-loop ATPase